MAYVYFDENGDLGFDFSKPGTSKHFSVAFMIVNDKRPVSSLVKKVFRSLPPAIKRKNSGILHAWHEKTATVKKLLSALATKDVAIVTIRINKQNMLIANNPNELYTNIVISLVNKLYANGYFGKNEHINLIASQRNTSKKLNQRFTESIINKSTRDSLFSVEIVKPSDDKCLQAVDFISWAFWQKYEKGDKSFVDLIADKVIYEYVMY